MYSYFRMTCFKATTYASTGDNRQTVPLSDGERDSNEIPTAISMLSMSSNTTELN